MSEINRSTASENDLEFYVSKDGRQTAMSQAGLSRCIKGESEWQPLRRLLNTLDINYQESVRLSELPKELQFLKGIAFVPVANFGLVRNRLITAEACSAIIQYYADQSIVNAAGKTEPMYPEAKESLKKFAKLGIDNFIKQLAGYQEQSPEDAAQLKQLMHRVLSHMEQQSKQLEIMEAKMNFIVKAEQQFPGIQIVVKHTNNLVFLPTNLSEPFTIREWVEKTKNRILSLGECKSVGRHAANSLTTLKLESPEKYGTGTVYRYVDIPGLESVWESWSKIHS